MSMRLSLALALFATPALAQVEQGPPNAPHAPAFANQTRAPALPASAVTATLLTGGLEHPWGIAALPDGRFLVTERPGRLRLVSAAGEVGPPIAGLPGIVVEGQGGLLDVALADDFAQSGRIYLTYAENNLVGGMFLAAASGVLAADGTRVTGVAEFWTQSPAIRGSGVHFGGRIVPDGAGHIFIIAGERGMWQEPDQVQALDTDLGKVIRLNADGSEPVDNPFAGQPDAGDLWTSGHRNPQGAALDGQGRLWTMEHGPAGGDELNLLVPGANHGWPLVSYGIDYSGAPVGDGKQRGPGITEPVYYWDPVIAPGGMAFYAGPMFPDWQGDILIGSLNPGGLVRLQLDGDVVVGEERLLPDLGRVRDVQVLADGSILLLTDLDDGGIWRVTQGS